MNINGETLMSKIKQNNKKHNIGGLKLLVFATINSVHRKFKTIYKLLLLIEDSMTKGKNAIT